MNRKLVLLIALGFFFTTGLEAQNPPERSGNVPLYRVTVVERTLKAVDYQYRGGPTQVDLRGTVLLPDSKGEATVESKAGRTEVDAKIEHLAPPARFGREYLTYVLWAITPEGHARNLGEAITGSSDKAKLHVTTDLQAFGLIVTAEPYSAVRMPSDVVVMENFIRPDTIGATEPVMAKYELLPRGSYTYNIPVDMKAIETGPKVSQDRYETMLEVYEAQNAVQIARSAGADRDAPDTFAKAESQWKTAQDLQLRGMDKSTVITAARQAGQTAEDARAIALKRRQDADLAQARGQVAQEQQMRMQAEATTQRVQAQAAADRITLENERAARQQAEAHAQAAIATAEANTTPQAVVIVPTPPPSAVAQTDDQAKRDLRASLLQELSQAMPARDTPRGLAIEIPDYDFHGAALNPALPGRLARVAAVIATHPGLSVEVNGHCDAPGGEPERLSRERAALVRDSLVRSGVPGSSATAHGLGNSQLLGPNFTAREREQNRRVEIVISGDPIGNIASWDRSYSISPRR